MLLNYQIIASCEEFQAKAFALELSELGWVLGTVVLSWVSRFSLVSLVELELGMVVGSSLQIV